MAERPSDAADVRITDTLPVSVTYAGGDAACVASGRQVTCSLGTLVAGASRTLLIQGNVSNAVTDGMTLTNIVSATTATATPTVTATAVITVRQPTGGLLDLSVKATGCTRPTSTTASKCSSVALRPRLSIWRNWRNCRAMRRCNH